VDCAVDGCVTVTAAAAAPAAGASSPPQPPKMLGSLLISSVSDVYTVFKIGLGTDVH